jgi:hypothetical protein
MVMVYVQEVGSRDLQRRHLDSPWRLHAKLIGGHATGTYACLLAHCHPLHHVYQITLRSPFTYTSITWERYCLYQY